MPIYEYECERCHHRFELVQKFSQRPLKKCAKCGGPVYKILSAPALVFKGSGWYVTDYANSERKKAMKADSDGGGTNGDQKSETADATAAATTGSKDD